MRLSGKAIAACALLSFTPASFAAVYLGGTGMFSEYSKYDDVKSGFGGSVFAGYRPESVPLMFEVSYLTTGKNKIDGGFTVVDSNNNAYNFSDMALSFSGEAISVGYFGRFSRTGSGAYAKVGYYTGKSKFDANVNGFSDSAKATSNGAMFAIGVDWMLTPYFGLRADIGSLLSVKDMPGIDDGHKSNVTTANIGVVFAFGNADRRYGSRYPRDSSQAPVYSPPVPAPVYSSPVPVPVQEQAPVYSPAVAPAPVAPAPVVAEAAPTPPPVAAPSASTSAGSAQLIPGAVLRSGPSMKSAGIRTLADGGSVKLIKHETNAEGPWWMVQLEDGTTGWMIEWSLTRISKH